MLIRRLHFPHSPSLCAPTLSFRVRSTSPRAASSQPQDLAPHLYNLWTKKNLHHIMARRIYSMEGKGYTAPRFTTTPCLYIPKFVYNPSPLAHPSSSRETTKYVFFFVIYGTETRGTGRPSA